MSADAFGTLAAFLDQDFDNYESLVADTDDQDLAAAVGSLFFVAIDNKFGRDSQLTDIITFVASVRSQYDDTGDMINTAAAERLIRAIAFRNPAAAKGINASVVGQTETSILAALSDQDEWSADHIAKLVATAREIVAKSKKTPIL